MGILFENKLSCWIILHVKVFVQSNAVLNDYTCDQKIYIYPIIWRSFLHDLSAGRLIVSKMVKTGTSNLTLSTPPFRAEIWRRSDGIQYVFRASEGTINELRFWIDCFKAILG